MKHDIYFLISPKAELVSKIIDINAAGMSDLGRPVMWSGAEYDKGNLLHEDFDLLAKILFLDVLKRERGSAPNFSDVFTGMEISETYFDSHWTLQRVPLDMSFEFAIEDAIASGTIDDVISAGSGRVDDFLRSYLKK